MALAATLAGLAAFAQETAPSAADRDFAAFQKGKTVMYPPGFADYTKGEKALWQDGNFRRFITDGVALIEKYPSDPRRWDVLVYLGRLRPTFMQHPGVDYDNAGIKGAVIDEAAKTAWQAKLTELWQAMRAATDRTPGANEELEWGAFANDFRADAAKARAGAPVDWAAFRERFTAHAARYPTMDAVLVMRANDFLGALGRVDPAAAAAGWAHIADTTANEELRKVAAAQAKKSGLVDQRLELKFTAADGREVDLAKLKGKVVLIDFWATWCGPCKAELPNIAAAYGKYHDRGFEVIGIALENARLAPTDTADQAAAKLDKARQVLADFTAANAMPWPQYFDGKFWGNDFAKRHGITAIPAMFLVDQQGRVVSTDARGARLEQEVKRLLGL